jgi:hypothetical protein
VKKIDNFLKKKERRKEGKNERRKEGKKERRKETHNVVSKRD